MVDIHSHILPGVDDGAQDIYDTLEMVSLAAESGIKAMVATPHCNIPGGYKNYFSDEYVEAIQSVRDAVHKEKIPVNILPGVEVFAAENVGRLLEAGKIMTLNQSRYLLMEFAFDEDPAFVKYIVKRVQELRAIPVIAHAERYEFAYEEPNLIYELRRQGFPIQINKGSFQGKFGKRAMQLAYEFLNHNLVSVVASDAHSPYQRTPYMADVYEELLENYPKNYLDMIFKENPRRICENKPILGFSAKRIEE